MNHGFALLRRHKREHYFEPTVPLGYRFALCLDALAEEEEILTEAPKDPANVCKRCRAKLAKRERDQRP